MFVDQVKVYVKGGDGGNGMMAFRREKYVPNGGPAGGDGGHGGNVVFKVQEGLRTLMDFRYQHHFKAPRGEHGGSKNQHGRNAEDMIIEVPPGTVVYDLETDQKLADLTYNGQQATIAKGGRGGRGNSRFATAANPAPHHAENGEPGEEREIRIELKLLADVGLVGFPSVGKSTLLSVISAAKPKIADYHFTTLSPNLGVVSLNEDSFVVADLPGLIEGAHLGQGLGHQFLRHIERTRVIIHVIDMASTEGRDPYDDYEKINEELRQYGYRLTERPQVVAANKMDMPGAEEHLKAFRAKVDPEVTIFPVSALSRDGLQPLLRTVGTLLKTTPEFPIGAEPEEDQKGTVLIKAERILPFRISREDDGAYVISGDEIEKLFKMTDFNRDESIQRFARKLRGMGIDDALRERGAEDGDPVRILDFEFEFVE